MIPHIIHYCWFGRKPMPELAEHCIASWHQHMPEWQFMRWDEDSLSRAMNQPNPNPCPKGKGEKRSWLEFMPIYVKQAYDARKFAFVSDYIRLWALERYGGLYMDVDFEVFRSFDNLMDQYPAFAGYEGSKRKPVMQGVIASEQHGAWVQDMLQTYQYRKFIEVDNSLDLTPNTSYFTDRLEAQGFIADGVEKDVFLSADKKLEIGNWKLKNGTFYLHVFPVHYFCPVLTTGEDVRTAETYCEHKGVSSWAQSTWKGRLLSRFSPALRTKLIKLKRKILG